MSDTEADMAEAAAEARADADRAWGLLDRWRVLLLGRHVPGWYEVADDEIAARKIHDALVSKRAAT